MHGSVVHASESAGTFINVPAQLASLSEGPRNRHI